MNILFHLFTYTTRDIAGPRADWLKAHVDLAASVCVTCGSASDSDTTSSAYHSKPPSYRCDSLSISQGRFCSGLSNRFAVCHLLATFNFVASMSPDTPNSDTGAPSRAKPLIASLKDLTLVEAWDAETQAPKYVTFYHVTSDEVVYFGQSFKHKKEISIAEYNELLEPIGDEEIYPEVPAGSQLKLAPEHLDDSSAFVKRPGLNSYETMKGTNFIPQALLDETLVMEQVSTSPHASIVAYYGCRVRRGRITAMLFERLDQTLTRYVLTPAFGELDKVRFVAELQSAVDYVHSLGLAHNDINPDNIMIKNGSPVLIDFGSCQPFGMRLQSLGTEGWYEKAFFTSEEEHDVYSLTKLRAWIQKPT
ncbi:unnamed protein product [Diplocarpon coronariae]